MPTSYQPHTRGDDHHDEKTHSQTVETNMSAARVTVAEVLADKGSAVVTIRPQDTLGHATELLTENRIGALLVADATGAIVGILSERDIIHRLAETPGHTLPRKVDEAMTRDVISCGPDDTLVTILRRMTDGRFRHMPVMDNGKLLGMISIGDVVNYRLTALEYEALKLKQLIVG